MKIVILQVNVTYCKNCIIHLAIGLGICVITWFLHLFTAEIGMRNRSQYWKVNTGTTHYSYKKQNELILKTIKKNIDKKNTLILL